MGSKGIRRLTFGFGLLAVMLLASCASGPKPIPRMEIEPQTYNASFDRTWEALNDVLSEQRYPIRAFEKDSGLVTTDFVSSGSRYHYWGQKDEAGRKISTWALKTRYFLNIRVRVVGDSTTTVDVIPHLEYMSYVYDSRLNRSVEAGWEASDSHGDIEQEIYDSLAAKLNR